MFWLLVPLIEQVDSVLVVDKGGASCVDMFIAGAGESVGLAGKPVKG